MLSCMCAWTADACAMGTLNTCVLQEPPQSGAPRRGAAADLPPEVLGDVTPQALRRRKGAQGGGYTGLHRVLDSMRDTPLHI